MGHPFSARRSAVRGSNCLNNKSINSKASSQSKKMALRCRFRRNEVLARWEIVRAKVRWIECCVRHRNWKLGKLKRSIIQCGISMTRRKSHLPDGQIWSSSHHHLRSASSVPKVTLLSARSSKSKQCPIKRLLDPIKHRKTIPIIKRYPWNRCRKRSKKSRWMMTW